MSREDLLLEITHSMLCGGKVITGHLLLYILLLQQGVNATELFS